MKQSIEKGFITPQPVFIIMFDSSHLCYREVGDKLGGAWDAGKKYM